MKSPLLRKNGLDAFLEALNNPSTTNPDDRTDKDYKRPEGKGTELPNEMQRTAVWTIVGDILGREHLQEELKPYRTQEGHNLCPECGGGMTRIGNPNGHTDWVCTRCKYGPKKAKVAAMMFPALDINDLRAIGSGKMTVEEWRKKNPETDAAFSAALATLTKRAHANFPDPGVLDGILDGPHYDEKQEEERRKDAEHNWQYAENGASFDPAGDYLCGTCTMRSGTELCTKVDGKISFTTGSCQIYKHGPSNGEAPLEKKNSKPSVGYTERPNVKGFGCQRCNYGDTAAQPDSHGRPLWCSRFGMHVRPLACCAKNEGDDDVEFNKDGSKKASLLVQIATKEKRPMSRIEKLEARHGKPIEEILKNASTKCPECGSTEYGLMPSDFETAKCSKCGKTWEIGLVKGVNAKKAAAGEKPSIIDELAACPECNRLVKAGATIRFIEHLRLKHRLVEREAERIFQWIHDRIAEIRNKKQGREIMHDDSGATTGLRMRPDYGESDSHSSEMNRKNTMGSWKSPLLKKGYSYAGIHDCPGCGKSVQNREGVAGGYCSDSCKEEFQGQDQLEKEKHGGVGVQTDQAIKIHETPRHLPPRNDMRDHLVEEDKKKIYEPLKVKQEGIKVGDSEVFDPEAYKKQKAEEDRRLFEENNEGSNVTVTNETFMPRAGGREKPKHVETVAVFPPIPTRNNDWAAYDPNTYDGAPDAGRQCVGRGATEEEALQDFWEQWEDMYGSEMDDTKTAGPMKYILPTALGLGMALSPKPTAPATPTPQQQVQKAPEKPAETGPSQEDWEAKAPISAEEVTQVLRAAAKETKVPFTLLQAIAKIESSYGVDPNTNDRTSANGLMQMTKGALAQVNKEYGTDYTEEDMDDPQLSALAGAQYMAIFMRRYHRNTNAAIAAYYVGPKHVNNVLEEYGEVTPETLQQAGHDAAATYLETAQKHMGIPGKKTGGKGCAHTEDGTWCGRCKTGGDPAWEADLERQSEDFVDRTDDMRNEARDTFMADKFMMQEAQDSGLSMEELWQEVGNDYANEYWQSRSAAKVAIKVEEGMIACPKCSSPNAKDVTDEAEKGSVRLMECPSCSHLWAL